MTTEAGSSAGVTTLLDRWSRGDEAALRRLTPLVEGELRRLARAFMRKERRGHTLQPTELVNEAYLRLAGQRRADWKGRAHFIGVAAQLMRLILVDYARQRNAAKRGGGALPMSGPALDRLSVDRAPSLVALDDALRDLERRDARKARMAELRFFGGLTTMEAAEVLGISVATAERDWRFARAWLQGQLT